MIFSESNTKVDLAGYPVLRIDQISYVDSNILINADKDVCDLINSLRSENDGSQLALVGYLEKQLDFMRKELTERTAAERIRLLLNGNELSIRDSNTTNNYAQLHQESHRPKSSSKIEEPTPPKPLITSRSTGPNEMTRMKDEMSRDRSSETSLPIKEVFKGMPLPSQLHLSNLPSKSNHIEVNHNTGILNDNSSTNPNNPSHQARRDSTTVTTPSISSSSTTTISTLNSIKPDDMSPRSEDSNKQLKRPQSGGASRRSVQIVNQNFGSAFVVAATEKKKRFFPKKAVTVNEEEVKEKDRLARRKVAMQRLMERRAQREQRQEVLRKKKLKQQQEAAKIKQQQQQQSATTEREANMDSSESESISGGDCEMNDVDSDTDRSSDNDNNKDKMTYNNNIKNNDKKGMSKSQAGNIHMPVHGHVSLPLSVVIIGDIDNETENNVDVEDYFDEDDRNKTIIPLDVMDSEVRNRISDESDMDIVETHSKVHKERSETDGVAAVSTDLNHAITIDNDDNDNDDNGRVQTGRVGRREKKDGISKEVEEVERLVDHEGDVSDSTTGMNIRRASSRLNKQQAAAVGVATGSISEDFISKTTTNTGNDDDEGGGSINKITAGAAAIRRSVQGGSNKAVTHIRKVDDVDTEYNDNSDDSVDSDDAIVSSDGNSLRKSSHVDNIHCDSLARDDVLVIDNSSSDGIQMSVGNDDERLDRKYGVVSGHDQHQQHDIIGSDDHHISSHDEVDDNDVDSDDDDDDDFIEPDGIYPDHNRREDKDTVISMPSTSKHILAPGIQNTTSTSVTVTKSVSIPMPPRSKPSVAKIRPVPRTGLLRPPSEGQQREFLTSFYEHIGMIFPICYSTLGPKQAQSLSSKIQILIESMQFQTKLNDEWLEVMADYATVFSTDRPRGDMERATAPETWGGNSSLIYSGNARALHFRVKSTRSEVCNIVTDVFKESLQYWEELPSGLGLGMSWNLLWSWGKPRINHAQLLVWQRVNHFKDSRELTRKDLLKKNLHRYTCMRSKAAAAFEIMPQTFLLPHEYTSFVRAFLEGSGNNTPATPNVLAATSDTTTTTTSSTTNTIPTEQCKKDGLKNENHNLWIMKPVGLSRGRGISLVTDISTIVYSQSSVIQKYVEKPLCLGGYKFDLRLYILVTSFRPLEAFIYKEGFARLSTQAYSLSPENISNKFIHLTNSSIQKLNPDGPSKDCPLMGVASEDMGGSKIALQGAHGLWARLRTCGLDPELIWNQICTLIVKSLVVVDDRIGYQPCSFEVFGYDVLLDENLRPWLLEVNASPSLARENALDIRVKNAMLRDTVLLLNPAPYDRTAVARILTRRLKELSQNKAFLAKNDPELENDLQQILGDYKPRKYGEDPEYVGEYERLCPNTKIFDSVLKLKSRIVKT
eukprot:gene5565-11198_t